MCISHIYRLARVQTLGEGLYIGYYWWPYSPKLSPIALGFKGLCWSLVELFPTNKRILEGGCKQAFWSDAIIPGVPNLLIHILRYNRHDRYTSAVPDLLHFPFLSPDSGRFSPFLFLLPVYQKGKLHRQLYSTPCPPFSALQYQVYCSLNSGRSLNSEIPQ